MRVGADQMTSSIVAIVIMLAGFADAFSTMYALKHGARETNPVIDWLQRLAQQAWPAVKLIWHAAIAFVVFWLASPIVTAVGAVASLAVLAVAAHNIYIVRR